MNLIISPRRICRPALSARDQSRRSAFEDTLEPLEQVQGHDQSSNRLARFAPGRDFNGSSGADGHPSRDAFSPPSAPVLKSMDIFVGPSGKVESVAIMFLLAGWRARSRRDRKTLQLNSLSSSLARLQIISSGRTLSTLLVFTRPRKWVSRRSRGISDWRRALVSVRPLGALSAGLGWSAATGQQPLGRLIVYRRTRSPTSSAPLGWRTGLSEGLVGKTWTSDRRYGNGAEL